MGIPVGASGGTWTEVTQKTMQIDVRVEDKKKGGGKLDKDVIKEVHNNKKGSGTYKKMKGRNVGGAAANRTDAGSELGGKRRPEQMHVDGEGKDGVKKPQFLGGERAEDMHNNEFAGLQG
ncbi:hypothetical protein ZWY2020_006010 [Hordeum vulgare]|nr:hypothetical protein ZWY2020_006010 [Hordeum vulgare]